MKALIDKKTLLQEVLQRLLNVGKPLKVVLFGSQARREQTSESDFDFLIIEPSNQPRYKRSAKYRSALKELAFSKDIVVWTPEEVAEWSAVPNAFITVALREGKILYERQG